MMPRTAGSRAPETRERILDAAIGLFQERGFAATSIRDLAERAGVTTAAMYYHFDGKDQILEALFGPCLQALQAIDTSPGGDQARQVLEQVMDVFAERGTALQAVMNDRSAMQHVRARTDFAAVLAGIMRQLAASDDPADLIRANCALGAVQRGVLSVAGAAGPTGPSAWAGADVSPAERAVIVAAALAALRSAPGQ
jgi:AcrR family transcriptional regulator